VSFLLFIDAVTSHEFLTYFSQFGNILDSVVMFDRETRKPRGFGFVTFDDPEVCLRLLRMGQMDTLHEEKESEESDPHCSGRLEMRGKLIEVKAAQPKSAVTTPLKPQPLQPHNHHHNYFLGQSQQQHQEQQESQQSPQSGKLFYDGSNDVFDSHGHDQRGTSWNAFAAKHPATLPHPQSHHHAKYSSSPLYGYSMAPPTPVHYGAGHLTPSTPVTPQQALDMAHHMMFYSHLLATPTLISPLLSPMMSPMIIGFDHNLHHHQQRQQQHQAHYHQHYSQHFSPYKPPSQQADAAAYESPIATPVSPLSSSPPPAAPDVVRSTKVPTSGTPFRIGGATFVLEEPEKDEIALRFNLSDE
jgi:RNA recognition motif. (a.k.a. RRM, RBD, or RNP domain)